MKNQKDIKYLGIPNVCFSISSIDDSREKEFAKQRIIRGFDDSETWSLTCTISKFILPRLKLFKAVSMGTTPINLSKEDWKEILNKMIYAFEIIPRDNETWNFTDEERIKIDEGLDLFRQYFFALWW